MAALISDAEATAIRQALAVFLVHTCAWRSVTAGAVDPDYDEQATLGDPVAVACTYRAQDRVRMDAGGATIVSRPTLTVAADAPVATGGQVSDIRNAQHVVLAAGPFTVGPRLDSDELGVTLQRTFELRAADPVRPS